MIVLGFNKYTRQIEEEKLLRLHSFIGFLVLIFLAWLFSEKRRKVNVRTLITGMGLQVLLALLLLKFPGSQEAFLWLNKGVRAIEESTRSGTGFVFGYLGGAALPLTKKYPVQVISWPFGDSPCFL